MREWQVGSEIIKSKLENENTHVERVFNIPSGLNPTNMWNIVIHKSL